MSVRPLDPVERGAQSSLAAARRVLARGQAWTSDGQVSAEDLPAHLLKVAEIRAARDGDHWPRYLELLREELAPNTS